MSEQIREQVSAFLDGELPNSETELLLKRLSRDGELRESFGRYAVIGEALRGSSPILLAKGFTSRINFAIDGEPVPANVQAQPARAPRWWRPFAGVAVAAGVAAVAVVGWQQRADAPVVRPGVAMTAQNAAVQSAAAPGASAPGATAPGATAPGVAAPGAAAREAISYTVPAAPAGLATGFAPARLTKYVFAHSRYSSGLDQRGVVADLLIESDEAPPAVDEVAAHVAP
jgi:negative regulator of sigma E activity